MVFFGVGARSKVLIIFLLGVVLAALLVRFSRHVRQQAEQQQRTSTIRKRWYPWSSPDLKNNIGNLSTYASASEEESKAGGALDEPSWVIEGRKLARVYPSRTGEHQFDWCVEESKRASGILYVKIQKCSSSTGTGVTLNVAHHVAQRTGKPFEQCDGYHEHFTTQKQPLPNRNKRKSLLWTTVRHPAKRALSSYFHFRVSNLGQTPTDSAMLEYIQNQKGFELSALQLSSLEEYTLKDIVEEMDFIALTDRMDESLVVFRLLFGLEPEDVIVLSSKRSGGYGGGMGRNGCSIIVPSFASPIVEEYLSMDFVNDNPDFVLYAAANASLDKTIDALGRNLVEKEVKRHKRLQQLANEKCLHKAKFPCSETGEHQLELSKKSCYDRDWGCGHGCIDQVLQNNETDGLR